MVLTVSTVRAPAVAGMFYPGDPDELARDVAALLAAAKPTVAANGRPKALIVPHAGYIYSGPIAATAFATIAPYAKSIERVVLVGPAHREFVEGFAHPDAAKLAHPHGAFSVELDTLAKLG